MILFPERDIYEALRKLEVNILQSLRKEVNEKLKKSEEMYSFCIDMLKQGKILFPPELHVSAGPTVTPMKFH